MSSKVSFTVKCLLENKLRFALTVLSISVGVVSILIVNSVSSFGVSAVSSELESLGMNGLIVSKESNSATLSNNEVEALGDLDAILQAAPVTVNTSKVYSNFGEDTATMIWGIDEKAPDVVTFELMYGRFINKGDIKSHSKVCIVDQSLANEIYGRENIVGKTVKLLCNSTVEDFVVVGVVKTGKGIMQSLMGNYFPSFLYVPYTSFENNPSFDQIFLKIDSSKSSEEVTNIVKTTLNNLSGSDENYSVTDLAGQKSVLDNMLNIVTLILTVIGAIALLVSSISIMNIMLISVNERTKEIGIKKSIGATNSDILFDFLTESVIISIIGTAIGIVVSIGIIKLASLIFSIDIIINIGVIIIALVISVIIGVVFGIFPAYKASRFHPVEALRR